MTTDSKYNIYSSIATNKSNILKMKYEFIRDNIIDNNDMHSMTSRIMISVQ